MNTTIGTKIKELRNLKGLSQPELASILEVSKGIISYWENDKNEPKIIFIKKLADIFNVSINYFLGYEDDLENPNGEYLIFQNELQTKFDRLTPHQQELVMERVRAFDDANAERAAQKSRTGKTVVIPVRTTDETYE